MANRWMGPTLGLVLTAALVVGCGGGNQKAGGGRSGAAQEIQPTQDDLARLASAFVAYNGLVGGMADCPAAVKPGSARLATGCQRRHVGHRHLRAHPSMPVDGWRQSH